MRYEVRFKSRTLRAVQKLPVSIQERFQLLLEELRDKGPWLPTWPNYSKLGKDRYHCHLNYSHVACWTHEKDAIIIEVYYVGSRQNAPY